MSEKENNNSEISEKKLKLAKTNSLEREVNSSLNKALHDKYGTVEDLAELRRKRRRDKRARRIAVVSIVLIVMLVSFVWLQKASFVKQDNAGLYKDLVTAIGSFTIHPNNENNLKNLADVLTKLSGSANVSEGTLAIGYAVFSIQEIDAGFHDIGIADCRRTIERFPGSPCTPNLKRIVEGVICRKCEGKGTVWETCEVCSGIGRCPKCSGEGSFDTMSGRPLKCPKCGGSGKCPKCNGRRRIKQQCVKCEGAGRVFDEKIFKRESTKIMTRAVSDSAFQKTKADVMDTLHKIQKKINRIGSDDE